MSKNLTLSLSCLALTAFAAMPSRAAPISANGPAASSSAELAEGFRNPPESSRLHAYWWWLNGNVTTEAITRDLESMKEKGFGGALIFDAGGANQQGNRQVPKGPLFGSESWRKLYRHALREGKRLHLEMALNIQSGWNLGGPRVPPDAAAKVLCWTETVVSGPGPVTRQLAAPTSGKGLVRDAAVIAVPEPAADQPASQLIERWEEKTLMKPVAGANHDTSFLIPGWDEKNAASAPGPEQSLDLNPFTDDKGTLQWNAPAGNWRIYRFCYTVAPRAHVSTCSEGWEGLAIDPMDPAAFQHYWDDVIEPLMKDAKEVGGNVLKYLHTDSCEIEPYNWTPLLPEEFKRRNGYDLTPWLPVLGHRIVASREASERFLQDYRKTVAALTAESYYGSFLKNAHHHGMQVRAESGGPHGVPIDAQHCLGMIDVPMSEFWASSWSHRVSENQRFFVKQPASAAHTYGKRLVAAEGFTTMGPHWQETVWDNLRPNFDHALCEGLNQLVWTLITCSPPEMGMPGQELFAGTHFNPNCTWWRQSEGFLIYINRCQWLLRQGNFVADVLYYYGDQAPNFAGLRKSNPADLPSGHDYDVASEDVLLHRVAIKDGRIVLPDGMSYAALVLPLHRSMSLPVLRKLAALADDGAVIIGSQPDSSSGLNAWRADDAEARTLIERIWKRDTQGSRMPYPDTAAWLKETRLLPDFVCEGVNPGLLEYIHRRDSDTNIYFVNNPEGKPVQTKVRFRIKDKAPEFWDPRDGSIRSLPEWRHAEDGRIELPLILDAYGSGFIVFRNKSQELAGRIQGASKNFPALEPLVEIKSLWDVSFDPQWFYPDNGSGGRMVFAELVDWTKHPDPAVRHFSGTAVYRTTFDFSDNSSAARGPLSLSLGKVHEMARVSLNGHKLGIAWCPPWTVPVQPGQLLKTGNRLEIEVVNFWPNRLIGDAKLPESNRRTRTNISKFDHPQGNRFTTLMPSGLLGPVRLMIQEVP